MTLNTFIAAVCVVVAIMLTIAHIRFFFGEETHKQQGELFHQPPHDEAAPVSAGDTLCTRRRDNAADLRILRKQIIVGAALTLVVVIPILIHTFAPHCPLGPLVDPWWQAVLITPVMFYSGYPVHVDGWSSLADRRPNMNTLASIGTIAAYAYGLLICFAGDLFPAGMRMSYFAIVGIVITLVLLARLVSDLYLPQQPAFPLQLWVDRFSFVFVPVVIMIALWTFVAWLLFGRQPALPMALLTAISVLIIACPCALGWAATLAAVFANENAGRHGLQIHSLGSLQIARHLTDVLFAQEAASRCQEDIRRLQQAGVSTSVIDADAVDDVLATVDSMRKLAVSLGQRPVVAFVGDGPTDERIRHAVDITLEVGEAKEGEAHGHADVIVDSRSTMAVSDLRNLSHAMMANIRENLVWTFAFNIIGIPIAAGVLYPFTSWLLDPSFAAIAMILSSLCVLVNSLRMRHYNPERA